MDQRPDEQQIPRLAIFDGITITITPTKNPLLCLAMKKPTNYDITRHDGVTAARTGELETQDKIAHRACECITWLTLFSLCTAGLRRSCNSHSLLACCCSDQRLTNGMVGPPQCGLQVQLHAILISKPRSLHASHCQCGRCARVAHTCMHVEASSSVVVTITHHDITVHSLKLHRPTHNA